jgi:hypothetical protein
MSLLNISRDMAMPQGLTKEYRYEATVVKNDDSKEKEGKYMCRIKARVPILFDGIEDDHLPWAIPMFDHWDGATKNSGMAYIPKVGSKVLLVFQEGSDDNPMWMGYPVSKKTAMKEMEHNYPDRIIAMRLQNKAITLYDTKTNELFIRNPGDMKVYIEGNTQLTVTGNVTEVIEGNKEVHIKGNLKEIIHGNKEEFIVGNQTEVIRGNKAETIQGNFNGTVKGDVVLTTGGKQEESVGADAKMSVGGNWKHSTGGNSNIEVSGDQINNAGFMRDQEGSPSPDSPAQPQDPANTPETPDLTTEKDWPGFPGNAKGENQPEDEDDQQQGGGGGGGI